MKLIFPFVWLNLLSIGNRLVAPITNNGWPNMLEMFGQFFLIIIIFIFVLFLAYFSTRLMKNPNGQRGNKNIKLIETYSLGMQNSIALICVGEKYFLIGITKDRIEFLTEVDSASINLEAYAENGFPSFDKIMENLKIKDKFKFGSKDSDEKNENVSDKNKK